MTPTSQLPVFYINLDNRPDRREFMEAQFARLGISAERISALTVADIPAELGAHSIDPCRLVSNGELACGLSHQLIWRRMASQDIPAALILEDDALLADNLTTFLAADITQRLGIDLLKLETRRTRARLGTEVVKLGDTELRELQSSQLGSAAYIITRAAAEDSLAHPLVNAMAIDRFLFGKGGLHLLRSRILLAVPTPAVQLDRAAGASRNLSSGAARSDIWEARQQRMKRRSIPVLGRLLSLNTRHAARLLKLVARDPGAIRRQLQRIPFAGDSRASAGP